MTSATVIPFPSRLPPRVCAMIDEGIYHVVLIAVGDARVREVGEAIAELKRRFG